MSRSVHIHPLAVVLAVVAGTTLGGIAGALIAVPLAAFLNTTVQAAREDPGQPDHEHELELANRGRPQATRRAMITSRPPCLAQLPEARNSACCDRGPARGRIPRFRRANGRLVLSLAACLFRRCPGRRAAGPSA